MEQQVEMEQEVEHGLFEGMKVKGMFRVQIAEDGEIKGDSGWVENLVTNAGFRYYLAYALGAIAGSLQVSHAALGTGGAPIATDTTLTGEVAKRQAVTAASSSTSKAVTFTQTFSSSNSFLAGTSNISNIGLANSSATGTLFSGAAFASSSCATNQDVYTTYTISFA
jgi:hypothetical protein